MLQKIENWDDITRVLVPRVNAAIDLLNKLSQIHGDGLTIAIDEAMDYEIRLLADQIVPGAGGAAAGGVQIGVVTSLPGYGSGQGTYQDTSMDGIGNLSPTGAVKPIIIPRIYHIYN